MKYFPLYEIKVWEISNRHTMFFQLKLWTLTAIIVATGWASIYFWNAQCRLGETLLVLSLMEKVQECLLLKLQRVIEPLCCVTPQLVCEIYCQNFGILLISSRTPCNLFLLSTSSICLSILEQPLTMILSAFNIFLHSSSSAHTWPTIKLSTSTKGL